MITTYYIIQEKNIEVYWRGGSLYGGYTSNRLNAKRYLRSSDAITQAENLKKLDAIARNHQVLEISQSIFYTTE